MNTGAAGGSGAGLTVTVPFAVAVQPDELVTVTEYVPAEDTLMLPVVSVLLHK